MSSADPSQTPAAAAGAGAGGDSAPAAAAASSSPASDHVTVPKSSLDFFASAAPKLHAYVRELQRENEQLRAQNSALRADVDILDSLSDFLAAMSKTELNYKQFMELKNREVAEAKAKQQLQQQQAADGTTKPLRAPTEPLPPLKDVPPAAARTAAATAASAAASSSSPSSAAPATAAVPSPSPSPIPSLRIRASVDADLDALTLIYAAHVLRGTASFEEVPPSRQEMKARREDVLARKLPYIVATARDEATEGAEVVVGYAYANLFRARTAYRFTLEHSIYVNEKWTGRRGIGRALLSELMRLLEQAGYRHLLAVIGDSANAASIGLHTRAGFKHVGKLEQVGFKFGRWIDVVLMQKQLGEGADSVPKETQPCEELPSA